MNGKLVLVCLFAACTDDQVRPPADAGGLDGPRDVGPYVVDGGPDTPANWDASPAEATADSPVDIAVDGAAGDSAPGDVGREGAGDGRGPVGFQRIVLGTDYVGNATAFGDLDRDGATDVIAGPYYYPGPDFRGRVEIYPPVVYDPLITPPTGFYFWVYDMNGDSWPDVVTVQSPGHATEWYENPRSRTASWTRHHLYQPTDFEPVAFIDLIGDSEPELVVGSGLRIGFARRAGDPAAPWTFRAVTDTNPQYHAFRHGLGVGDVDGDGRRDIIEKDGIYFQPSSLAEPGTWRFEAHAFAMLGSQMYAYDIDGDGDADIASSLHAHGYGIAWFEQRVQAAGRSFSQHLIAPFERGVGGVLLYEPHALEVADVNGDGLQDLISGERFWSHGPSPGYEKLTDPALLVWFELQRDGAGTRFVPHVVDRDCGIGTQISTGDANGDGLLDIAVASKKGSYLFLQTR